MLGGLTALPGHRSAAAFAWWTAIGLPAYWLTSWWARTQSKGVPSFWVWLITALWLRVLMRMLMAISTFRPVPLLPAFRLYAIILPPVAAGGALAWLAKRIYTGSALEAAVPHDA